MVSPIRWIGITLARLVAIGFVLLGAWVLVINLPDLFVGDPDYTGWILAWILVTSVAAIVGGVLFLLSFDGPQRFRTRQARLRGWVVMFVGALIPSMILPFLVLLVLALIPSLYLSTETASEPVTSE